MADKTVGIDFVINVADGTNKLEAISKSWEKVIEQEINAKKSFQEFVAEANKGYKQLDAEAILLRKGALEMMRSIQQQKIAVVETVAGVKEIDKQIAAATKTQERGILSWVKGLFSAKKAQEDLLAVQQKASEFAISHNKTVDSTANNLAQLTARQYALEEKLLKLRKEARALEAKNDFTPEERSRRSEITLESGGIQQELTEITQQIDELKNKQLELKQVADQVNEAQVKGAMEAGAAQETLAEKIARTEAELAKLQARQDELLKTPGVSVLNEEFRKNEAEIDHLTKRLAFLKKEINGVSDATDKSSVKGNGFRNMLSKIGPAASTALKTVASIAVGVATAGAAIGTFVLGAGVALLAFTKQNEYVQKSFAEAKKKWDEAKKTLRDALAPVGVAVAEIFNTLATRIGEWAKENEDAIFQWAVRVGSHIAGFASGALAVFNKLAKSAEIFRSNLKEIGDLFKIVAALATGDTIGLAIATAEFDAQREATNKLNKELAEMPTIAEAASEGFQKMFNRLSPLQNVLKKVSPTKEQIEAWKKMKAELESGLRQIEKQLVDLDIKNAGPLAGVILQAEIAAKAIEKEGVRLVDLAKKLGKNKEEIAQIEASVARIAKAFRDEAFEQVITSLVEDQKEYVAKLQSAIGQFANTNPNLILGEAAKALDGLKKERDETFKALQSAININADDAIITGLQRKVEEIESQIRETQANAEFEGRQRQLDAQRKRIEQTIEKVQLESDKLRDRLNLLKDQGLSTSTEAIEIKIELAANEADLRALNGQLDSLRKGVTVPLLINSEDAIAKAEDEIKKIQPDVESAFKVKGIVQLKNAINGAFSDITNALNSEAGQAAQQFFSFVTDLAIQSADIQIDAVNRQIESIDKLVDRREQAIDELGDQLDREVEFKAAGLANNYELVKQNLEAETKARDEELAKRDALEKRALELEEKRAQIKRTQDAIAQTTSLITASAQIFQGFSSIPVAGVPLAIAAIAAMFAAFAAFQIKAAAAAKRAYRGSDRLGETFGELAPNEGYDDHPSVDRGLLVYDRKGKLRGQIGGDEALMKESVSRQHRQLLKDMNVNEAKYRGRDLKKELDSWANAKPGFQLPDPVDMTPFFNFLFSATKDATKAHNQKVKIEMTTRGITKGEMTEAISSALQKQTSDIIDYFEQRPTFVDDDIKNLKAITAKSIKKIKRS